jgi:enoyl-CoA hydratase/3-hydroxyacyl-CoA dehydrogenase
MFNESDKRVAIIGAGTMGAGIAQKYAHSGFHVDLIDQNEASLKKAESSINKLLSEGITRGIFSKENADDCMKRIRFSNILENAKYATLVIEAIFEDLIAKKNLFKKLDTICSKTTILASNTSSFLISDLLDGLSTKNRVIGLHYFYHPAKNRLVELIATKESSPEHIETAKAWQIAINKIVIESKDSPGFIVNRFFVPWLNEAMRIVQEEKANIATVESACKSFFGIAMGPFQLMNVTGPAITWHSALSLAKSLGDFYSPAELIKPIIESGTLFELDGDVNSDQFNYINERLLTVLARICCTMIYDEGVSSVSDLDLSARVGLLWKKGPFALINENKASLRKSKAYAEVPTEKLPEALVLKNKLAKLEEFSYPSLIVERSNNCGIIRMNRPDTLNALDESLIIDLTHAFLELESSKEIVGIVITGHARAFMAGADLSFFNQKLDHLDFESILNFAQAANELFLHIDRSPKTVIAAIDGLALGGGLEFALACDAIVASPSARLGFPETGIGIYPGLGGTQRTPRKIGLELARFMVLTGTIMKGHEAHEMGLVDVIASPDSLIRSAVELATLPDLSLAIKRSPQTDSSFHDLLLAFADQNPEDLTHKANLSDRAKKALEQIHKKAPLAVEVATRLLALSKHRELEVGLSLEAESLEKIFKSNDAKNGLASALKKTKVTFNGH